MRGIGAHRTLGRIIISVCLYTLAVAARVSFASGLAQGSEDRQSNPASNPPYKVGGYIKSYLDIIDNPSFGGYGISGVDPVSVVMQNTFRLDFKWNPSEVFGLQTAWALSPTIGKNDLQRILSAFIAPNPFLYRAYDIPIVIYPDEVAGKEFVLSNNLDRLFVAFKPAFADIYFGRQPISFGSARLVSPLDIFSPFMFSELDKEERVGVDAARIRFPIGSMQELDIGYVFGDEFRFGQSAVFSRVRLHFLDTDFTPTFSVFRGNLLLGVDVTRSLGGAGIWFEEAYVLAGLLEDYVPSENYLRISLGADYNLSSGLYGLIEYHYNGAGRVDPQEYKDVVATTAVEEGSVYLLGQHYLGSGLFWEVYPLLKLTAKYILNMNDPSAVVSLVLEYNPAEDLYIDFGTYLSFGKESDVTEADATNLSADNLVTNSEFGLYPSTYFMSCRFYF